MESRNSCSLSGKGVGAEGIVTDCARPCGLGNNIQPSQMAFAVAYIAAACIALGLGHCTALLLGIPAQSLIEIILPFSLSFPPFLLTLSRVPSRGRAGEGEGEASAL